MLVILELKLPVASELLVILVFQITSYLITGLQVNLPNPKPRIPKTGNSKARIPKPPNVDTSKAEKPQIKISKAEMPNPKSRKTKFVWTGGGVVGCFFHQ